MPAIVSGLARSMARESPVWSRVLIAHAHRYPKQEKGCSLIRSCLVRMRIIRNVASQSTQAPIMRTYDSA